MAKMKEILNRIKQHLTKESQDRNTQIQAETTRATNAENSKIGKVANATENNIPLFDSNGAIKDSGKSLADTGKIDSISIDGTPQVADANKNVDLPPYPTKESLGLDNVNNTSDLNKPISTATQGALDLRALITETGNKIDLEIDNANFKITAKLYDKNNTLISTSNEIDLPLESVVVGGRYDNVNKKVILTLENGNTVEFSVADLVYGLQSEITSTNKLSSDLVDDTNNAHKFVSSQEKTTWNNKQDAINPTNKVSADNIDDTNATNKFVSLSEKQQITTNATNIANIKDGQSIDSFADVESALENKVDKSDIGYVELDMANFDTSTKTITFTQAQALEMQKKYCILKFKQEDVSSSLAYIFYKAQETSDTNNNVVIFNLLPNISHSDNDNTFTINTFTCMANLNTLTILASDSYFTGYDTTATNLYLDTKLNKTSIGLITLTSQSGTLTDAQYEEAQKPICIIALQNEMYCKIFDGTLEIRFCATYSYINDSSTNIGEVFTFITITKSTKAYIKSQETTQKLIYKKSQVDDLLLNKQDVIDNDHKLSSDLVDDTNQSNKFVNVNEKAYVSEHTLNSLNLYGLTLLQGYIQNTTQEFVSSSTRIGSPLFDLKAGTYTLTFDTSLTDVRVYVYSTTNTSYEATTSVGSKQLTFTLANDETILLLFIRVPEATLSISNITNIMLNKGSESQPYQPYNRNEHISNQDVENISKSLYHLGAYDSENGKTRKTLIVNCENLSWTWHANSNGWYTDLPSADYDNTIVKSAIYPPKGYSSFNSSNTTVGACIKYRRLWITTSGLSNELPKGIIETLLSSDYQYTDTPIKNESILPLDTNMANKIRQKVVDGLNLWKNTSTITKTGTGYVFDNFINPLKPGTYTFSFNYSGTVSQTQFIIKDVNDNVIVNPLYDLVSGLNSITFTINSDSYYATFYTNSAGTYSNIMLVEADHSYPYSDFNQKEHITNEEATLLKQEEEKCRNLFDMNNWGTSNSYVSISISTNSISITNNDSSQWQYAYKILKVKPNTTYTLSYIQTYATYCYIWDTTHNTQIRGDGAPNYTNQNITFTTPSGCEYIQISFYDSNHVGNTCSNIMLNEGSEAKPYTDNCGAIVHTKDIEPVLLWKNPSPNSSFNPDSGQDYAEITVKDRSPYKYIKLFVSLGAGSNIFQIITLENTTNGYETQLFMIDDNATCWTRSFKFVDNTTIRIGKGKNGSSAVNNNRVVPKYIYGTNVL